MSEHTKGTIDFRFGGMPGDSGFTLAARLKPLVICERYATSDSDIAETVANGHRLVACWNACEGIADPTLIKAAFPLAQEISEEADALAIRAEMGVGESDAFLEEALVSVAERYLPKTILGERILKERAELRQQRDALLEALELAERTFGDDGCVDGGFCPVTVKMRQAIAMCKAASLCPAPASSEGGER